MKKIQLVLLTSLFAFNFNAMTMVSNDEQLTTAAQNGNTGSTKSLVTSKSDVDGDVPLVRDNRQAQRVAAIKEGQTVAAMQLLQLKSNPDGKHCSSDRAKTPLMIAAESAKKTRENMQRLRHTLNNSSIL